MKNNKGLSEVVTTLIIILLVLVAIGIIWGVVSNLLDKSKNTVDINTKCMDVGVKVVSITETQEGNYSLTVTRTSTGDEIDGVALKIYLNDSTVYGPLYFSSTEISPLKTITLEAVDGDMNINEESQTITKTELYAFFTDDSGVDQLCPTPSIKTY